MDGSELLRIEGRNLGNKSKPERYKKLIYYFFLFSLILSPLSFFFSPKGTFKINSINYIPYQNCKVYLFILQPRNGRLNRIIDSDQLYARDFEELYYKSDIEYLLWNNCPKIERPYRKIHFDQHRLTHYAMHHAMKKALEIFLESSADWLIRSTEDNFIDLRKLGAYIHHLDTQYDPRNDLVLKGMLVNENLFLNLFIHGGSGWIISRKLAERMMEEYIYLMEQFNADLTIVDDRAPAMWIDMFKLDTANIKDSSYIGAPINTVSYIEMLTRTGERCKITEEPSYLTFGKNLVFWHSGRFDNIVSWRGYEILDKLGPRGFIYQNPEQKWVFCLR